jgi:hypothetical protein
MILSEQRTKISRDDAVCVAGQAARRRRGGARDGAFGVDFKRKRHQGGINGSSARMPGPSRSS